MDKVSFESVFINPENPRVISEDKMDLLINSVLSFPEMMEIRPIVIDEKGMILGGNMRFESLKRISITPFSTIIDKIQSSTSYKNRDKTSQIELLKFWEKWIECPEVCVEKIENLSEDQKKEFVIKDNAGFGEWDYEDLRKNWDNAVLEEWGVEIQEFEDDSESEISETEKLSDLTYTGLYYEPSNIPQLKLEDCVNLEKFNKKIEALNTLNLNDSQKEVLKIFAYRFIKIDFESVANYYAFNASEEEKEAIERLRLVLVDNGIDGFIEDDMLRVMQNL